MVCPRRLSFSQFVILMSTTNGEKDSLLGQTILPLELGQFFGGLAFLGAPFNSLVENWNLSVKLKIIGFFSTLSFIFLLSVHVFILAKYFCETRFSG